MTFSKSVFLTKNYSPTPPPYQSPFVNIYSFFCYLSHLSFDGRTDSPIRALLRHFRSHKPAIFSPLIRLHNLAALFMAFIPFPLSFCVCSRSSPDLNFLRDRNFAKRRSYQSSTHPPRICFCFIWKYII